MTTTWHVGVLGIMSLLIAGLVTLLPGVLLGAEDAAASRPADPPRVVVAGVVVDPANFARVKEMLPY